MRMPISTTEVPMSQFIVGQVKSQTASPDQILPRILHAIRAHLGMDVAFVSEFTESHRVFRYVDSPHKDQPVRVDGADPLEDSYCQRVVDGRLPELIHDAATVPAARELPVTTALPVGAHISVPINLKSGSVYGTLCCFSFTPNQTLNERDIGMMRVFAELVADQIDRDHELMHERAGIENRVNQVLSGNDLSMVYQPIYQVTENRIVGFESLARFTTLPTRSPDIWFNEAAQVGLAIPLEAKAIRLALEALNSLPSNVYVSVNVSPETILKGNLGSILERQPLERILLEITEHAIIDQYDDIVNVIEPLRNRGLRVAVDDAGAGYASFRHILKLTPDVIKLDNSITRDIDKDNSRYALALALISFATATNCKIVAEGVETFSELAVLRQLGVNKAQGYFLGKPMALASAKNLIRSGTAK